MAVTEPAGIGQSVTVVALSTVLLASLSRFVVVRWVGLATLDHAAVVTEVVTPPRTQDLDPVRDFFGYGCS